MTIQIDKTIAGKTIREYLREDLGCSVGMLKRLKFMDGGITVNGAFVTVRYVLREGDTLQLSSEDREEDTCPYMIPVDLPLPIVYEDDYITAVDKPPAMPATSLQRTQAGYRGKRSGLPVCGRTICISPP